MHTALRMQILSQKVLS